MKRFEIMKNIYNLNLFRPRSIKESVHLLEFNTQYEHLRNTSNETVINSKMPRTKLMFETNNKFREPVIEVLELNDFNGETCEKMIQDCPLLKKLSYSKILNNFEGWMSCQFGQDHLKKLLISNPQLLLIDKETVERRILKFSSMFSQKYVYKIIFNAPNSIWDSWNSLEKKMDFLIEEMKIPKAEVVSSGVLRQSMHHIKERIEFLSRVGVFRKKKLKSNPLDDDNNPRLDLIVNSSDTVFAQKIAKVSLFEYEIFQEMFNESDSESEYSDTDDSE